MTQLRADFDKTLDAHLDVLWLVPKDRMVMDPLPIIQLYADLGEAAAEEVICRALDDLILRVSHVAKAHRDCDFDKMRSTLRRVVAIANQLGQIQIAKVAGIVIQCTRDGDAAALSATLARLRRISNSAVGDIWNLRHQTL